MLCTCICTATSSIHCMYEFRQYKYVCTDVCIYVKGTVYVHIFVCTLQSLKRYKFSNRIAEV